MTKDNVKSLSEIFSGTTKKTSSSDYVRSFSVPKSEPVTKAKKQKKKKQTAPKTEEDEGFGLGFKDIFDVLGNTVGLVGGAVTDPIATFLEKENKNEPVAGLSELTLVPSLYRGLKAGAKNQWGSWHDDKASWADVPGFGFLEGLGENQKHGSDIAKALSGSDNKWVNNGGGFALDVALDPLTYLTMGASAASKLGKGAEAVKLAETLSDANVLKHVKDVSSIRNAVDLENVLKSAGKLQPEEIEKIVNPVKEAYAHAYNANINRKGLSLPFSNKVHNIPFANSEISPKILGKFNNPLYRSEQLVGEKAITNAAAEFESILGKDKASLNKIAQKMFKGKSLDQLNQTEFNHLYEFAKEGSLNIDSSLVNGSALDDYLAAAKPEDVLKHLRRKGYTETTFEQALEEASHADLMELVKKHAKEEVRDLKPEQLTAKDLREIAISHAKNDKVIAKVKRMSKKELIDLHTNKLSKLPSYKPLQKTVSIDGVIKRSGYLSKEKLIPFVKQLAPDVKGVQKGIEYMDKDSLVDILKSTLKKNAVSALKKPYVEQVGDFRSGFDNFLSARNVFNKRTFATGNKEVDNVANILADADQAKLGLRGRYETQLRNAEEFIKANNLTKEDTLAAIYHAENYAPKSFGGENFVATDKQKALAELLKPINESLFNREVTAGLAHETERNPNYFHHAKPEEAFDPNMKVKEPKKGALQKRVGKDSALLKRQNFKTIGQWQDTLASAQAKLDEMIKNDVPENEIEDAKELVENLTGLFETDIIKATRSRIKKGVNAVVDSTLKQNLQQSGMLVTNPKTIELQSLVNSKDYIELDADAMKNLGISFKGGNKVYIQSDVKKALEKADELFKPKGIKQFMKQMDSVTTTFRILTTYYKGTHYRNNILGNTINNFIAGIGTSDYKYAGSILKKFYSGEELTQVEKTIVDLAHQNGVVHSNFFTDLNVNHLADDSTKMEKIMGKVNDNLANNKYTKFVRGKGEKIEEYFRLANFVNGLKKYRSPELAAKQVREILFNYNELTDSDKMVRSFVPFWNWTKNNIPLQIKTLMENPKFARNIERFKDVFNEGESGADWQKEEGIHVPNSKELLGGNYYVGLASPTHDLDLLVNPTKFLGSLNPMVRMPFEIGANRQFFSGQQISYDNGRDFDLKDFPTYAAHNFGVVGNAYDIGDATLNKTTGGGTGRKTDPLLEFIKLFNPTYKVFEPNKK